MKISKSLCRGFAFTFSAVFMVANIAGSVLETYRNRVDDTLGTKSYDIVSDGSDQGIYTADYENTQELVDASKDLYEQIGGEGTVMMKNNGSLPLEKGAKVTLLGLRSSKTMMVNNSTNVAEQTVSLYDALTEEGFQVNPVMNEVYETLAQDTRFNQGDNSIAYDDVKTVNYIKSNFYGIEQGTESEYVFNPAEPKISDLEATDAGCMDSVKEYSDAAVIVLGRPNVEGGDYYPGEAGIDPATGARNPFSLTTDEKDLITFAKENFENVVIVLNSAEPFELAEEEADQDVDAIFWVGLPGHFGYTALARILDGTVNPSGKLTNLYASDTASAPAYANFGNYFFTNADEMVDGINTSSDYVVQAEGIYEGYRYFETRYADCVMGQGNADSMTGASDSTDGWNYAQEVVYPFGYGESYTTFEQTLDSIQVSDDIKTVTAKVTVTNTGDVAGKDAVELYASAPYYKGGVEKSAIQLLDYAKTDILEPGASQTVEITADLQYLASYDYINAQTYILDAGTYYFSIGNGSHEALNNVLTAMGYTQEDGMDAGGNLSAVKSWDYQPDGGVDDYTFATAETGNEVTNQLQDMDLNTWMPGTVTYLSRSDWEGTWPKTYEGLAITEEMAHQLKNDTYEIATDDDTSDIAFNKESGVRFYEMANAEYDDPRWDEILDGLDLQEASLFITYGNRTYRAMPAIGFVGGTMTENGPTGFAVALSTNSRKASENFVDASDPYADYVTSEGPCTAVVAATFNKELQNDLGVLWGNVSLFNGMPLLWGGSMNLQRTTYNARNNEYLSEDPVLTGSTMGEMVAGAREKGLVIVIKHFAFNEQCSNQEGNATFVNEQAAREMELRSFQIAVGKGALGIMTSYNRVGAAYSGANVNLLQNVLRDEWGYHGYIVSDWGQDLNYMTFKEGVIAGTTNFDFPEMPQEWSAYLTDTDNAFGGDATMQKAIKESVHNALYTFANSNLMNTMDQTTEYVELNVWWRAAYKSIKAIALILAIAGAAGYVYETVREGRKEKKK